MNLRVKVGTAQLPHVISAKGIKYVFSPDATVPDEYGKALLKTHPNLFEVAQGEADMSAYTVKPEAKRQTLVNVIGELSEEDQMKVLEFVLNIQGSAGKKTKEAAGKLDNVKLTEEGLADLSKKELVLLATKLNVEVDEKLAKAEFAEELLKQVEKRK